ncbi:MAG: peptidoglycan editing factor PgeF [Desulfobacter sp.]|nr:MAG: peptidoglycan editing factor PgeF [Desulfobacter sp.]
MAHPDILAFDHFKSFPQLVHGVFSRKGGMSTGPHASLNIGLNCGDDEPAVVQNRNYMMDTLGVVRAVFLNQVHGTEIKVLKQGEDIKAVTWDKGFGRTPCPISADGIVTNIRDLALVIQVADCQAVMLYDPVNQVIANVHSGWRGSVANIIGRCVQVMAEAFSSQPRDIFAGISPSLGPCCAEFIHYKREIPKSLWAYKLKGGSYFDFWTLSCDQLVEKGVKKENILSMGICTQCRTDRFFSFREEKNTGRFGAVIAVTKERG